MRSSTLRIVSIGICCLGITACSNKRTESFDIDQIRDLREPAAESPSPKKESLLEVLASASAKLVDEHPPDDFAAIRECPHLNRWQKFDSFAPACGYVWTTDANLLPNAPEWSPCSSVDITPASACTQLKRSRRIQAFHVGMNAQKKMQLGFVETCNPDQLVLADIDGPTRFALRRATNETATICPMKLLAADLGQWLAAFGEPESMADAGPVGYTAGGAFVGGTIGSAPEVLLAAASEPFHVATSQGRIVTEGWMADGKKRYWNGKPMERTPRIGWQRLTKQLFADEKKGFYELKKNNDEPFFAVTKGNTFTGFQVRDKQIVWQEESSAQGHKTCTLFAGEIDPKEALTNVRGLTAIPCGKLVLGCNSVLAAGDSQVHLVSLTNGSSRILRLRAHPVAIDCKEAFVDRSGMLLRIDLAAFSAPKVPSSLPIDQRSSKETKTH